MLKYGLGFADVKHTIEYQAEAATLESICVYFDTNTRKAIAIIDEMRAQASPYLEVE